MTSTGTLVFGAVAILVVVAWFVFGVVDGTRPDPTERLEPVELTVPAADEPQSPRSTRTTAR